MIGIQYTTIAEVMLGAIPELKSRYEAEHYWQIERQGPHMVLATTLNPYLDELLDSNGNAEILRRIFVFLEKLATHPDSDVRGVIRVTVCEHLGADRTRLEKARRLMGRGTLHLSEEIEAAWRGDRS